MRRAFSGASGPPEIRSSRILCLSALKGLFFACPALPRIAFTVLLFLKECKEARRIGRMHVGGA
mgnify:CR=1 FL=1